MAKKIDEKYIPQDKVHIFTADSGIMTLGQVCQNYSKSMKPVTGENIDFFVDMSFTRLFANNITESQADFYSGLCNGYQIAKEIWM